jgi:hypothetical protein
MWNEDQCLGVDISLQFCVLTLCGCARVDLCMQLLQTATSNAHGAALCVDQMTCGTVSWFCKCLQDKVLEGCALW